jgi:hypothetical protein
MHRVIMGPRLRRAGSTGRNIQGRETLALRTDLGGTEAVVGVSV